MRRFLAKKLPVFTDVLIGVILVLSIITSAGAMLWLLLIWLDLLCEWIASA
ncbi:MAG: hypothetical protein AAF514_20100 [Verrucomicrobiota bacterium]